MQRRARNAVLVATVVASGALVVGLAPVAGGQVVNPEESIAARSRPTILGTPMDLGTLGGKGAVAVAVDRSVVVGTAHTADGMRHAFVYDMSAMPPTMVGLVSPSGRASWAVDVDDGVVIGVFVTAEGNRDTFAYDLNAADPHMIDLGTLGGTWTWPMAVDDGVVVGSGSPSGNNMEEIHPFAYDLRAAQPHMIDLRKTWDGRGLDVSGGVAVGYVTMHQRTMAFSYDVRAGRPALRELTPGLNRRWTSGASAIAGSIVVGNRHLHGDHPFWLDLKTGASETVGHGLQLSAVDTDGRTMVLQTPRELVPVISRGVPAESASGVFVARIGPHHPRLRDIGSFGGSAYSSQIAHGVLVGVTWSPAGRRAFAYDAESRDPVIVDLGVLPGTNLSSALDTDGTTVVGWTMGSDGVQHATAWSLTTSDTRVEAVEPVVTVTEGHQAVLTLQRTGSAAGPSSVSYRTTNGYLPGQAVAGQDFGTTSGVVTFKPGQRAKRIRVPTIADRSPETAEHFVVVIEDPHGTAIGGTAAVDVQIQDAS